MLMACKIRFLSFFGLSLMTYRSSPPFTPPSHWSLRVVQTSPIIDQTFLTRYVSRLSVCLVLTTADVCHLHLGLAPHSSLYDVLVLLYVSLLSPTINLDNNISRAPHSPAHCPVSFKIHRRLWLVRHALSLLYRHCPFHRTRTANLHQ